MSDPKQDVLSLAAQLGKFQGMPRRLPPVEKWDPDLSGDMDMVIKKDGGWYHEGDLIQREKLVRLFSTILKREGDEYYLVTPVEKWRIQVEDVPFQVVLCRIEQGEDGRQTVSMITNVGDEVTLRAGQSLTINKKSVPVVEVRNGLFASLNRNVYYQLADIAEEKHGQYVFLSNGVEQVLG